MLYRSILQRALATGAGHCRLALTGGLTAGTIHAAVDFIWYVPACSTLMMILGACAVKLASKLYRSYSTATTYI